MIMNPQKFLEDVQDFVSDGGKLSKLSKDEMKEVLAKIEPVLESEDCAEEKLKKIASLAEGFRGFIRAIAEYYKSEVGDQ